MYPEEAVQYLNAIGPDNGPPKRVLNYYNWGGFIMLHAPGAKVFIDGRANTLYDETIYKDYQLFLAGRPTPERLARYPADVALLPAGRFTGALEKFQSPWKPIYRDWAMILAPPGSPLLSADLPAPSDVVKGGIQPLVRQAVAAANRGDNQQAAETLEKALEIKPYAIRIYGMLAQLYAKMGSFDQLSALIDRGIRENPRQDYRLRYVEGSAFHRAGQLPRALVAYKLGISKGPFSRPEPLLQRIKALERELARQERGY
jgi:tetratricopeptide (TPR) repeat protein